MKDEPFKDDPLSDLRQQATLREYRFTSTAPLVGSLVARLREAWNNVATKWQARPLLEQQSAFNRGLVDWLERPPGAAEFDARLVEQDRAQVRATRDAGLVGVRAGRLRGDLAAIERSILPADRRPRMAYFSPMPPARSGIAGYSSELLPYLAELADITVFADEPSLVETNGLPLERTSEFPRLSHSFDFPLYQMGNSDHHELMVDLLVRFPGIVVLHDVFLHHFIFHHTAVGGDWMGYSRELNYALDGGGRALGRSIRSGQAPVPLFELPMNQRIIDAALGVIVHSRYAAEKIEHARPDVPLAVIPALVEILPGRSRRDQLSVPDGAVVFASYGYITLEKQIDVALSAFRQLLATQPDCHYLLVGEAHPAVDIAAIVAELGLADRVHHIGYLDDLDTFVSWIHTADVVINLRQPTVGETSAIALRAMAAARPLIVYDHGWYAEIPPEAALKIPPDDKSGLLSAMVKLAGDDSLRRSMGQAGNKYIRTHCLPQPVARAYIDFIHTVLEWDKR